MENTSLSPDTYETSRQRFRQSPDNVAQHWHHTRLEHYTLKSDEDLTIDWIGCEAQSQKKNIVIFTTGEHGIEGYIGAALLFTFIDEFLPRLNSADTGLLLVHSINPWGMKHYRRVNANNVDLNRNFMTDNHFPAEVNLEYTRIHSFLNPNQLQRSITASNLAFSSGLAMALLKLGSAGLHRTTLLGQYRFPQGVYYGGEAYQEETSVMIELYQQALQSYEQVILFDMHTGYGPRYQMSMVNSQFEPDSSSQFAQKFGYPLVVKSNPSEFYSIQGDMIDYLYKLQRDKFPATRLFATTFEFGTFGDSLLAVLRSLRATILENQFYWYGAKNERLKKYIHDEYRELFFPSENRWRAKALRDARQAFEGVLRAYQVISK